MAKKSMYEWIEKDQPSNEAIQLFQEQTGCSRTFAILCLQRGIQTKEALEKFTSFNINNLHDPYLMYDMEKSVARIREAIHNGERILVYGDYDADGITSTTILVEAIDMLGGDVRFYLPNRFIDGYGPNIEVFNYMVDVEKINLIITCDNGVSGHEAIHAIMVKGVDVIVTDHHELPEELPKAYSIVHPRHPNGQYPFGDLSGAGVAFKLATALLEELPTDFLDIVAIGTVADLVSLTGENRILVKHGVDMLKQTQRIGLIKLLENIGISQDKTTVETIGFGIAPRLNALGRLDDATPGVNLLMTFDDAEADSIVTLLHNKNNERKDIVEKIILDVEDRIEQNIPNVIVLADENWHAGVLGIVASRIVEKTGKPTILLQINKETKMAKGSGRSVEQINLYQLLTSVKDQLHQFGGHHMAAGMTVPIENITTLSKQLCQLVPNDVKKGLVIDTKIVAEDCTPSLVHELNKLAPFGTNHDRPIFKLTDVTLSKTKPIGTKQQHLKGLINTIDFIKFNALRSILYMKDGVVATVVGQLSINEWKGLERIQIQLLDEAIDSIQLFDMRSTHIKKADLAIEQALYLFSDKKYYDYFIDKLPNTSRAAYYKDVVNEKVSNVVLFDCPANIAEVTNALSCIRSENIYIQSHVRQSAYSMGMPSLNQFKQLYKIIYQQKTLNIRSKLDALANHLSIQKTILILMIQALNEANIIDINEGILSLNNLSEKIELRHTNTLKQHELKMEVEKLLIYTQFDELCHILKKYLYNEEVK